MRWVKVIDEEAEKVNCGEMKFDIFPVFEDSLGSVRMRIVVQPKMDKKIGEIMPKQIPPQNWSDDMVRERIERVTQSDAFEIRLNKDVEYNLRASVLNYIKNNQALAIDTALISLMPHAEFFKFVRHIQKNGYILKPVELQKPMILPANGMVRFYIYDVMFTVSPDGSVILMKKAASFENAVTFANAHKNDLKACMCVAEELNKNESVSCSPYLAFQLDAENAFDFPFAEDLAASGDTAVLNREKFGAEQRHQRFNSDVLQDLLFRAFLADVTELLRKTVNTLEAANRLQAKVSLVDAGCEIVVVGGDGRIGFRPVIVLVKPLKSNLAFLYQASMNQFATIN